MLILGLLSIKRRAGRTLPRLSTPYTSWLQMASFEGLREPQMANELLLYEYMPVRIISHGANYRQPLSVKTVCDSMFRKAFGTTLDAKLKGHHQGVSFAFASNGWSVGIVCSSEYCDWYL